MSKRKGSRSKKNGEELQELNKGSMSVVQEKGGTPSATHPGGSGASVQPAARHHSETESDHSEQSQVGCHEETYSYLGTSQASGEIKSKKAIKEEQKKRKREQKAEREKHEREKREQKEKEKQEKEKQEKEKREQKEKEKQEKEKRQPKNTDKDNKRRGSLLGRHKNKDSDVQLPVLSTSAQRQPSDDRSPSETSSIIEADDSKSKLSDELHEDDGVLCTASVDGTLVVNHESQTDQLKIEVVKLTAKQSEKDKEIASLRREKEQMVTEVREALHKRSQASKEGQTPLQTHKLRAEIDLETADEEEDRLAKCHKENISEIKSVQDELLRKGSELKKVTDNSETAIKSHLKEIESLKAKYGEDIGRLQGESLQGQREKETEIADLKLKVEEAEEKATELEAELGKIDKDKYKEEIEKLQAKHAKECSRLQEAKEQNETAKEAEIKEWKTKCHESEQEIGKLGTKLENLEIVKEEHETELKTIRAEHAQECSRLREATAQDVGEKETEIILLKTRHHEAEQEIAELVTKLDNLEKGKEELEIELKNINAEHAVENSRLSKEKESEIEQWRKISEEAENKVKQLQEKLEKLDKKREKDMTCALPPDHHMEQIKTLNCEIERAHAQHASEIAELTSNLESKNKELIRQIEERNEELRHQLDEAKRVHSEQLQQVQVELENRCANEIAAMKVNYEEKQKKEDQSIEQRVEKKFSQLEKASRDKFHELKSDNEKLKTEADKLKKEAEEYLTLKEDLEKKDEMVKNLEVQLKRLQAQKEQKEHDHKLIIDSQKSNSDRKQKVYETQLQEKAAEMESLSVQLDKLKQQVLALEHEKNEQSEALNILKAEIKDNESRITYYTLEMAKKQSKLDEQSSSYKELQERYGQLEIEAEMKKELSATTGDGWIHSEEGVHQGANPDKEHKPQQHISDPQSDEEEEYHSFKSQNSLHQDNLTDAEKSDLQCQISDRDRKIKELEYQLSKCKLHKVDDFDEELPECAERASDANEKMVPLSQLTTFKEKYLEATEKLVETEEKLAKVEKKLVKVEVKRKREKNELVEKLEDRQKQLEAERQIQHTLPPYSSKDPVQLEGMDYETAVCEVSRLQAVISEQVDQISSLQMQVKSKATQQKEKENQSEEQSQTVKDWQQKFEAEQGKRKDGSALEAELAKAKQKISDLEEEMGIYKSEINGEKQNVQQEVKKIHQLECQINQLHHENVHLEEQLAGYDKMNKEVGILRASATNMLKRFKLFLGKDEAEHPTTEKVDLECDDITKRLSELVEELGVQKIQAEIYKKDFEEERKEREEAAKNKDEEIAAMQTQFSKTVKEQIELQSQLDKAHQDIANVRAELESSKKLLEEALTNAEQDTEKHKQELSDMEQILQHNQKELQHMKARLDDKVHSLEDEQKKIALDRDQLRDNRDKLKEERDDLQKQVQESCDENDRISSELKAKVKEAEIHAAEKNHIENEYHHLQEQQREANCVRDALQSELIEVKEQLQRECADKVTLEGESLAKTQQVKQYKKQVDHYKAQLQESSARIEDYIVQLEQCKHELAYCQTDLKKREEYEQNTADYMSAQYESELSTLKLEVGALKREKADMEVQLRQHQIGTVAPDTASYVGRNEKEKAELYQKYISLRDRYDVMFQYNDRLVAILVQNNITVPNAKTPLPQAQRQALTSPYQERVIHDGRQYNRQSDPNRSITTPAEIRTPHDQQLNYEQYQQRVGGVASSPPSMQRAGEGAALVVSAGDHQVHSHEVYHESNPLPMVYNQGQPSMYQSEQGVGHPSGGGEGVPVNYPQGYGQPQPPSAATYGSTYPESQNYSGMGMRPSDDIGAGQQGLMTPEPETGRRVASGPHENALIKGINTEIHSVAAGVGRQVDRNPEMDSLSPQAPFDPNLICPMCRLQYRIGEIQKYRKHVKYCQGT